MTCQPEILSFNCPLPSEPTERIQLAHGSGGKQTEMLIRNVFFRYLKSEGLAQGNDAATLSPMPGAAKLILTTDAHAVSPIFYPGGDIGRLAVSGTVNDLLTAGATVNADYPLLITTGFILEEGLLIADLERVLASMRDCAREAGAKIVAGDTKVVEHGKGDSLFITTSGLGWRLPGPFAPDGARARPGDHILISGEIASHGMAVLCARNELGFSSQIRSDNAPLSEIVSALRSAAPGTHVLRDPTRGGLATTLNEIAIQSQVSIEIDETAIPLDPQAAVLCEMLGFDPLYVANEGKMVVVVPPEESPAALQAIRASRYGEKAVKIGEVLERQTAAVLLKTAYGTRRRLEPLSGEMLPRIC